MEGLKESSVFSEQVNVKLSKKLLKLVNEKVAEDYVYESVSHFIRCAIIEKLRK